MSDFSVHPDPQRSVTELRIKAEYRRVAVYFLIGYVLLVGAITGLNLAGLGGGWDRAIFGVPVLGVLMLALPILIFRQRLRIDDAGVWRRRLFRWDLWPWEAFASGKVEPGTYCDSFVFSGKPWWHRYLFLEFLEKGERQAVGRLLRDLLTPALIEVPESLKLNYGFRKWLVLSSGGIRYGWNKQSARNLHLWDEVRQVRVKRLDHSRRDFHHLELDLGESAPPTILRIFKGSPTWKGADADVILALLERHVDPQRFEFTALTGPPRDAEECKRRLREIERGEQQLRRVRLWTVPVVAIAEVGFVAYLLIFGKQPANPLQWHWTLFFVFGSCLTLFTLLALAVWMSPTERLARLKKQREELEAWRDFQTQK
jgi:hypothetical protein